MAGADDAFQRMVGILELGIFEFCPDSGFAAYSLRFPTVKGSFTCATCTWDLRVYRPSPMGLGTQILPTLGLGSGKNPDSLKSSRHDRGLNHRPLALLASALPTELFRYILSSPLYTLSSSRC